MHAGPAQGIRWEDFYAYQHYAQAGAARVARGWGTVWTREWRGRGGLVAVSASGCDLYMYMSRAVEGCLGAVGVGLSHACVVRGA